MTKITIQNEVASYSVEVSAEELSLPELIEHCLRPCLYAVGYAEKSIKEAIPESV